VLAHFGRVRIAVPRFSKNSPNRFNRRRQRNPQSKQSSVGNQTITRARYSARSCRAKFQCLVDAQEDNNHVSSRRDSRSAKPYTLTQHIALRRCLKTRTDTV
jgi:hypothetical protein